MTFVRPEARGSSCWLLVPLFIGGTTLAPGCGPTAEDAGAPFLAAVSDAVRAPPDGVAPCQRRALCVPENPCHVGQVTGCRGNVPICTDIGAWLPNGATCGVDCVCLRGQPNFCDAGAACFPLDPWGQPDRCQLGTTVCTSGRPVCAPLGTAPNGTACGDGAPLVCRDGICAWCQDGDSCTPPGQQCVQGVVESCSTGGTCTAGSPLPNGTWCDGGACLDGVCNPCPWGAWCDTGNPCQFGYVECSSGNPICMPNGWAWDGTSCPGGTCRSGFCVPSCSPGQPCTPQDACTTGSCNEFGACEPTGSAPNGTPCGDQLVCSGGACTPCGVACAATDLCSAAGVVSCATGLCEPAGPVPPDDTLCGPAGERCLGGFCKGALTNPLVVRTAMGGTIDVAGTAWSACYPDEPLAGMSRRAVDGFGTATFAHASLAFPFSTDCSGPSATSLGEFVTAAAYTEGDRIVGWGGAPPNGLGASVTATAAFFFNDTLSLRFLLLVDDRGTTPHALYRGEAKNEPRAPDGYPILLAPDARPLLPACEPAGACQGLGGTCRTWSVACDYSFPACLETGVAPESNPCGVGGETCAAGDCVGAPGAPLIVRTFSGGQLDLTGLTFAICVPGEPEPWLSRRRADTFIAGGTLHAEDVYGTLDCSGTPDAAQSWSGELSIVLGGDRFAAWRGPIPWNAPTTLWTTGVIVSGTTPGGPFTAKDLVVVDVDSVPWRLYTGQDDNPTLLDAEGYPAYMLDGAVVLQ